MAINRFSQGPIAANIQSNFIPLPVDAIAKQIDRKQNQYDTTKAYINSMQDEVLKVKGMGADAETLKEIQNSYVDRISKEVEGLGGDYSRAGGIAEQVARDLRKDYTDGKIGQINTNYLKGQAHLAELEKKKADRDISEAGYNLGLKSISEFQGTKEIAPGKYSAINLYTPTKYANIPQAADDYAARLHDQTNSNGDKYLTAKQTTPYIYANLNNDASIRANAEEEVRNLNPNISKPELETKVKEYLTERAQEATIKRQFYDRNMDASGAGTTTTATGKELGVYNLVGANPEFGKLGVAQELEEAKDAGTWAVTDFIPGTKGIAATLQNYGSDIAHTGEYEEASRDYIKKDMGSGVSAEDRQAKRKEAIIKKISGNDIFKDMAEQMSTDKHKVDITTLEGITEVLTEQERLDKRPKTVQPLIDKSKTAQDYIRGIIFDPAKLKSSNVIKVSTGKPVSGPDVSAMAAKIALASASSENKDKVNGAVYPAGTMPVESMGQILPVNTHIFSVLEKGELVDYAILPDNTTSRNAEYVTDRTLAAYNNGTVSFPLDGETIYAKRVDTSADKSADKKEHSGVQFYKKDRETGNYTRYAYKPIN